jgi:LysR family transcriptional regulator, hydrogen peroxide-inducible genes activator
VQGLLAGVKGRLAVGSIPTVMPYLVANRISGFLKEYPDVDLQLVENTTSRLVDGLQVGDLDLAVLSLPLSIPEIVCGELFREQILLAVPPNHRLAQLKVVALRELRQERLLLLREGHCFRDNSLAACRKARITPNAIFESDQFASIFALVATGAGVSLVPAMAVPGAKGCSLLPIEPESSRRIGYAHVRRQFRPPAQKAFIEWLKRSVGRLRSEMVNTS